MDRLAELAGYAQSFPSMVDDDFIAAGFTPEEISSYRSQTAPQFEQFAPTGNILTAPDYTMRERAVQGSQDFLSNTFGMNPYSAGVLSRNVLGDPNSSRSNYGMGLADFTPLGAVFATQEGSRTASRGYEAGDPVQMGLGGLEVLLGVAEGIPIAGRAVKPLSKAVINTVEEVFDTPFGGEVLGYLRGVRDLDADFLRGRGDPALAQGVGADVPGRPPLTFDEVEAAMKAEAPAKPTAAELRRQANIQRFGYDPSEVVERTPTDDAGFEAYLEKVNPGMKRIAEEARPNLMMGDMYGMMPKGSEVVGSKGNVTFHRSPNGEYYATAFNPDVNEEDVIGYITDRGDGTELAVVSEMQGQGVGGELQYLFRKENPNAPTGGLTEAGEGSLRRTYKRLADEGIIGGDVGFDVVRKDASSIFGEGSERVRYTDPKTGGTMEVVVRPDGSASVLELEVPEASRGKGIGQSLQERVMQDFPVMGGQVSSKAAATTAYRLGRRPVGKPNATLEDVFAEMDDMSSVNMISPQMQALRTPADEMGFDVWHGTPHEFPPAIRVLDKETGKTYVQSANDPVATGMISQQPNRYEIIEENPLGMFDFSKMGTGEGAQAYGWGGYQAERKGIGQSYRNQLTDNAWGDRRIYSIDGQDVPELTPMQKQVLGGLPPEDIIANRQKRILRLEEKIKGAPPLSQGEDLTTSDFDRLSDEIDLDKMRKEMAEAQSLIGRRIDSRDPGALYQSKIMAKPEDFMSWERPLSEQSQIVKEAFGLEGNVGGLLQQRKELLDAYTKAADPIIPDDFDSLFSENAAQKDIISKLGKIESEIKNTPFGLLARDFSEAEVKRIGNLTGEKAYKSLVDTVGALDWPDNADGYTRRMYQSKAQERASQMLNKFGVPGSKHIDAATRSEPYQVNLSRSGAPYETDQITAQSIEEANQLAEMYRAKGFDADVSDVATRNYVVFDENLINIVKKYGIAGAATMLGVSALDVEQALADNLAPSDWEDLVAGPQ
jgi:hypothetical protein